MNRCPENRRRITELVLSQTKPHASAARTPGIPDEALQAHIDQCESCRRYLREISELAGRLANATREARPALEVSENFHQRVLRALRNAPAEPQSLTGLWLGRQWWKLMAPACAVALVAGLAIVSQTAHRPSAPPKPTPPGSTPMAAQRLPPPVASEYWLVASRSLDQMDDLLNRQAKQNLAPAPALKFTTLLGGEP